MYLDHMNRLERVEGSAGPLTKKARTDHPVCPLLTISVLCNLRQATALQDTVGAIAVDARGILCAGVSSGGLSLKLPGRVGHV